MWQIVTFFDQLFYKITIKRSLFNISTYPTADTPCVTATPTLSVTSCAAIPIVHTFSEIVVATVVSCKYSSIRISSIPIVQISCKGDGRPIFVNRSVKERSPWLDGTWNVAVCLAKPVLVIVMGGWEDRSTTMEFVFTVEEKEPVKIMLTLNEKKYN